MTHFPIDPCGCWVDWDRDAGTVDFVPWRGSDERQRVFRYFVPPHTPALPIPHCFMGNGWQDKTNIFPLPPGVPGEMGGSYEWGWSNPRPWTKTGDHFCGHPRAWLEGAGPGDPPLEWTAGGFSTCCQGISPMGTAYTVSRFAPGGVFLENSRITDDPESDCIDFGAGICAPWISFELGGAPANPPAGRAVEYYNPLGLPFIIYPDGSFSQIATVAVNATLANNVLPVWDATVARLRAGRITDPASGPVTIDADLQGPAAGITITGGTAAGAGITLCPTTDPGGGPVKLCAASYLLLPVLDSIPTPPAGWVAVGMTAAGLAAIAETGDTTCVVAFDGCAIDAGIISPEPGLACLSAAEVVDDTPVTATHPGGATEHWWRLPAPDAVTYRLRVEAGSSSDLTYTFLRGGTCGTLTTVGSLTSGPDCIDALTVGLESVWCLVESTAGAGGEYTISLAEGSCP